MLRTRARQSRNWLRENSHLNAVCMNVNQCHRNGIALLFGETNDIDDHNTDISCSYELEVSHSIFHFCFFPTFFPLLLISPISLWYAVSAFFSFRCTAYNIEKLLSNKFIWNDKYRLEKSTCVWAVHSVRTEMNSSSQQNDNENVRGHSKWRFTFVVASPSDYNFQT